MRSRALSAVLLAAIFALVAERAQAARSLNPILRDLEKLVAAEKGQDAAAMDRLESEAQGHFMLLMNAKWAHPGLARVVADKSRDWRLRRLCALALFESVSSKVPPRLLPVVQDAAEPVLVRSGAALGLTTAATRDKKVLAALEAIARDPQTPPELLNGVMQGIAAAGTDDLALLEKLIRRPLRGLKMAGTDFNAVRALARSKHPEAPKLFAQLIRESPVGSLKRGSLLLELEGMADWNPTRFREITLEIEADVLKMLDEEKFGGGNLDSAIIIAGKALYIAAVDKLVFHLQDMNQDPVVLWRAAVALAEIGDIRALPYVRQLWEGIPNDPRSDYQLRKLKASYEQGRRNQIIPGIKAALDKLERHAVEAPANKK